jgi:Ribosomal protein L11 methyltransferase (PrmA)
MVAAAMLEGLPPNRAAHVMRLSCGEAAARRIAAIIAETFDPATTAAAAFEEAEDTDGSNNAPWIVEAYFGDPPDEANVRALVGIVAGAAAARAASFDRVDERDWVGASLEGLTPVRAGRFLIHGAHGRDAVKANDIAIEIEAALAFWHRPPWFDAWLPPELRQIDTRHGSERRGWCESEIKPQFVLDHCRTNRRTQFAPAACQCLRNSGIKLLPTSLHFLEHRFPDRRIIIPCKVELNSLFRCVGISLASL